MEGKKKIKLIQIIADSSLGGGPKHVLGILENIDQNQFDCYLVSPAGNLHQKARGIKGIQAISLPMDSSFGFSTVAKLKEILARIQTEKDPFGPMIIHAHGPRAEILAEKAKPAGTFSVYTEHIFTKDYHIENRLSEFFQKRMISKLGARTNLVIAVSNSVRDFLLKINRSLKNKIVVIPNGIEIKPKSHSIHRRKISKENPLAPIVGSVGNLNKQKGYIYLIQAIPEILKVFPQATFQIIGDGEERENLEREVSDLNIRKSLTFLGRKDTPEDILSRWSVFVLPSVSETFGIAILEAFRAKVPVVATRVGGIVDIVENKKNGLLIPAGKPSAIAQAVVEILKHPALAAKFIRASEESLKKYDWQKIIKKIEVEYLKIVKA